MDQTMDQIKNIFKPTNLQQFQKRFEIKGELGKGSTSYVQKAFDNDKKMQVVLKQIDLKTVKIIKQYILRQTQIINFKHENLMEIYECIRIGVSKFYIISELCQLGNLSNFIYDQESILHQSDYLQIFYGIVNGMKVLHEKGIIHRDIKPENIFLTRTENGKIVPKIGDFGCCKLAENINTVAVGTPIYSDPKSFDYEGYSVKFDIFSLGVMLFEMVLKKIPFEYSNNMFQLNRNKEQYLKHLGKNLEREKLENDIKIVIYGCLIEESERFSINNLHKKVQRLIQKEEQEEEKEEATTNSLLQNNRDFYELDLELQKSILFHSSNIEKDIDQEEGGDKEKVKMSSLHGKIGRKEQIKIEEFIEEKDCQWKIKKKEIDEGKEYFKKCQEYCGEFKKNIKYVKELRIENHEKNCLILFSLIINFHFFRQLFSENQLKIPLISIYVERIEKWLKIHIQVLLQNLEGTSEFQKPVMKEALLKKVFNYQRFSPEIEIYFSAKINYLKFSQNDLLVLKKLGNPIL